MDRRRFLSSAATLAGAGVTASLLPGLAGATAATRHPAPQLLRLDPDSARFVPAAANAPAHGLRLVLDAFCPGPQTTVDALRVEALFQGDGAAPWRHLAWHYVRDDALGSSRAAGFTLSEGFRGLELHRRAAGASHCLGTCLDPLTAGLPAPGRYVLLLDPVRVPADGLPYSGDPRRPLGHGAPDHFSLQVQDDAPAPDLALRLDLACQRCDTGTA